MSLSQLKQRIKIVLVETETPGNLGATARAMKTMGFSELRLVKPKRADSREATARAVSAEDVLRRAKHFSSLAEAISDCALVFGTSGQIESLDQAVLSPRLLAEELYAPDHLESKVRSPDTSVAIIFGRESRGLTRAELALCKAQIRIPSDDDCPSLNLAAAVQIICYELSVALSAHAVKPKMPHHIISSQLHLAPNAQLETLLTHLKSLAINVGALNPQNPRQMMQHLRQLFLRAEPRSRELSLMISLVKRAKARLTPNKVDEDDA